MRTKTFMPWVFAPSVLVLALGAPSGFALETSVEEAVLKGNWQEVFETLEKDNVKARDPVARLLMAHACLATDRNNASMSLFLSVKEEKDLKAWSTWTESLLRRHPQNPVAFYLSADAKARTGKLKEAIEGFTQALKEKEDFALALNARGVIRVLTNEWDEASVDFYLATKLAPGFADAYANLGTLAVMRESSLSVDTAALEAFNQALTIDPEFALAYNGRGCLYFGSGEFEKAAQDFSLASQLSPALVTAEINQGFASAYASQLITLASVEKKPGTTLESIFQQHQITSQSQQQAMVSKVPDQAFWKKIDALPHLSPTDRQALVNTYGLPTVQKAASLKMQNLQSQITETNREVQILNREISSLARWSGRLPVVQTVVSLGFSASGTAQDLKKGWKPFLEGPGILKAELRVEKAAASSLIENRPLKAVIDATPLSLTPQGLAASTASSVSKIASAVVNDKLGAAMVRQESLTSQIVHMGAQLQAFRTTLPLLGETRTSQLLHLSPTQTPGYYTSMDRPLTDLSALASTVDKGIQPTGGSARSALIVSQDPFRANLLQSELNLRGFQTKVSPPGIDPQIAAKQWGADVILGIKPSEQLMSDQRKLPPFFPPDRGGGVGAVGSRQILPSQPLIKQNWDWGKFFTPTLPKPGGISTEEIARAFVDKGNWPVMTSFSLFYKPAPSAERQKE